MPAQGRARHSMASVAVRDGQQRTLKEHGGPGGLTAVVDLPIGWRSVDVREHPVPE
jgi:hypothetical protein